MEAKKDNVIRFPGRKSETADSAPAAPAEGSKASKKKPSRQSKALAALSLIVLGSWLANRWSFDGQTELASTGGRAIASVSEHSLQPEERDNHWERTVAKDLSARPSRDLASLHLGQRPSVEDRLRFSILKSQYSMVMNGGKLSQIQWSESSTESAVYIGNKAGFLSQIRELLPMNFAFAISENRQEGESPLTETFELVDENRTKVGEARFGLDRYGRLLSLVVADSTSAQ